MIEDILKVWFGKKAKQAVVFGLSRNTSGVHDQNEIYGVVKPLKQYIKREIK